MTEEVTQIDLVQAQIKIAGGATLESLGIGKQEDIPPPRGYAIQCRITCEDPERNFQVQGFGSVITACHAAKPLLHLAHGIAYVSYGSHRKIICICAVLCCAVLCCAVLCCAVPCCVMPSACTAQMPDQRA